MTSRVRSLVVLGALLVSLTGCNAMSYTKSLCVTGVSLEVLADQFEQVSIQVTAGCTQQAIPKITCDRYRVFGENFKRTYPLTVGLWQAANKAGDAASQRKAEAVAKSLAVDLSKLAVEALGSLAPEVK